MKVYEITYFFVDGSCLRETLIHDDLETVSYLIRGKVDEGDYFLVQHESGEKITIVYPKHIMNYSIKALRK